MCGIDSENLNPADDGDQGRGLHKTAGPFYRCHDLRNIIATQFAEAGVPELPMKALLGYMNLRMLDRYSHIQTKPKRNRGVFIFT